MVADIVQPIVNPRFDDPYLHRPGLLLTAVDDGVLLTDGLDDGFGPDREVGQCRKAHIDVHHGVLLPVEGHFLHTVHGHEPRFDPLRPVAQLRPGEAGPGRKAVIDAVHIAEIVAHHDLRRPFGEAGPDVEHLAAQLVPQLGNLAGGSSRIEFDQNLGNAVIGLRGDLVHQPHRLHLTFDGLGHELLDFAGRGAGVGTDDRSALDDENRIFLLAQPEETRHAARQQHGQEEPDHLAVSEGVGRQIHRMFI